MTEDYSTVQYIIREEMKPVILSALRGSLTSPYTAETTLPREKPLQSFRTPPQKKKSSKSWAPCCSPILSTVASEDHSRPRPGEKKRKKPSLRVSAGWVLWRYHLWLSCAGEVGFHAFQSGTPSFQNIKRQAWRGPISVAAVRHSP